MTWSLSFANTTDTTTFATNFRPRLRGQVVVFAQRHTSRPFEIIDPGVGVLSIDGAFWGWLAESVTGKRGIDVDESFLRVEHDMADNLIVDRSCNVHNIIDGMPELF